MASLKLREEDVLSLNYYAGKIVKYDRLRVVVEDLLEELDGMEIGVMLERWGGNSLYSDKVRKAFEVILK